MKIAIPPLAAEFCSALRRERGKPLLSRRAEESGA